MFYCIQGVPYGSENRYKSKLRYILNVSSNNGFTTTKGTSSWVDVLLSDVKITYQLTDPDQLAVQSEQIPPERTTIVTHQ